MSPRCACDHLRAALVRDVDRPATVALSYSVDPINVLASFFVLPAKQTDSVIAGRVRAVTDDGSDRAACRSAA